MYLTVNRETGSEIAGSRMTSKPPYAARKGKLLELRLLEGSKGLSSKNDEELHYEKN